MGDKYIKKDKSVLSQKGKSEGKSKNKSVDVRNDKKKDVRDEKIQELGAQLKRALADYQNLKKDMKKQLDFEGSLIRVDLLRSIIGLADDIDVAVDHVNDDKGWREGITMILEKFRTVIEGVGAEMIDCKPGDKFNAVEYEAVGVVNEGKDGCVAKIVQNGYRLNDIVIRPVRVIVNKIIKKQ